MLPTTTASQPRSRQRLNWGWLLTAVAVYVTCAAFFIGADQWDPLATWGFGILLVNSVAVGLVAGRWWMLLAPLSLIALAPLGTFSEPPLFYAFVVPALVIVSAALIALGLALRMPIRRRGAEAERRAAYVGLGLLGLAVAITGWGIHLDHRVIDRVPFRPLLIDERTGAYRGIVPGAPAGRAQQLFGEPVLGRRGPAPSPLDVDPVEVPGPSSRPNWEVWRYKRLVVFASGGRVRGYLTTDPSAQTALGAGVGDSLAVARRRHPSLRCYGVTLGSDTVNPSYPACEGSLPGRGRIFFGGDPIGSIWVMGPQT